jgi:hypothetical protein
MKSITISILFLFSSSEIYCSAMGYTSKYYGLIAGIVFIGCLFGFGTINNYEKKKTNYGNNF